MRITLWITALLAFVAAGVQGLRWSQLREPDPAPAVIAQAGRDPFPDLPPALRRNVALEIGESGTLESRALSRLREQVRDWLLYLTLTAARKNAGDVATTLLEASAWRTGYTDTTGEFQHGPTRSAALRPEVAVLLVPEGQSAEERSDAIAVAADRHRARTGLRPVLMHVIAYCLDDQGRPDAPSAWRVTLERLPDIPGARLYSDEFGWIEASLRSGADLERFLGGADDLISAEVYGDALAVGARRYRSRTYGHLKPEHVATIWQAYGAIDAAQRRQAGRQRQLLDRFVALRTRDLRQENSDLDSLLSSYGKLKDVTTVPNEFKREFDNLIRNGRKIEADIRTAVTKAVDDVRSRRRECGVLLSISRLRAEPTKSAQDQWFLDLVDELDALDRQLPEAERSLLRGQLGFSLDTAYHVAPLRESVERFLGGGHQEEVVQRVAGVLVGQKKAVEAALDKSDREQLRCLIQTALPQGLPEADLRAVSRLVEHRIFASSRYQTARYDGGLAGTEVGQILFQTDLLAKLYGMDFDGAAFRSYGPAHGEWRPTVYRHPSEVHGTQDERLPGMRVWFGLRNDGFAVQDDKTGTVFSQVATRVFALSHEVLDDGNEVQPSSLDQQWVDYFNNHYNLISRFENRYDQLNQIIKWSLVLDRARASSLAGSRLSSDLQARQVARDLWFPDWMRKTAPGGTAPDWVRCFDPPLRPAADAVETMPVLHVDWPNAPASWCASSTGPWQESREDLWLQQWMAMQGGVSLPRSDPLSGRPGRREFAAFPDTWRPQVEKGGLTVDDRSLKATFTAEYGYQRQFELWLPVNGNEATVTRSARAVRIQPDGTAVPTGRPVLQRDETFEVRPTPLRDRIVSTDDRKRVTVETAAADSPVASTTFEAAPDGFAIRHSPQVQDIAVGIAMRLSGDRSQDWPRLLRADTRVSAVVDTGGSSTFGRLQGGEWIEFKAQPEGVVRLNADWQGRASERVSEAERVLAASLGIKTERWVVLHRQVPESQVAEALSLFASLEVSRSPRAARGSVIQIRGPPGPPRPPEGPSFTLSGPDEPFRGSFLDPRGRLAVIDTKDRRISPDTVVKTFAAVEEDRIRGAKSGETVPLVIPVEARPMPDRRAEYLASLRAAREAGLRGDASATIASVRGTRDALRRDIEQADASGMAQLAADLRRDFRAAFSTSGPEALADGIATLRTAGYDLGDSPTAVSAALNSRTPGLSLAERAERAFDQGGGPAFAKITQTDRLILAQAAAERSGSGVRFGPGAAPGAIRASIDRPYMPKALEAQSLPSDQAIYLDRHLAERLSLAQLSDLPSLRAMVPDLIVLEIRDPDRGVARTVRIAMPDEVTLGPQWHFKPLRPAVSGANSESFARDRAGWRTEYTAFSRGAAAAGGCGGNDCGDSGGGEGGGGNGTAQGSVQADASGALIFITSQALLDARRCGTSRAPDGPDTDRGSPPASEVPRQDPHERR